jgi:hypothetical protein
MSEIWGTLWSVIRKHPKKSSAPNHILLGRRTPTRGSGAGSKGRTLQKHEFFRSLFLVSCSRREPALKIRERLLVAFCGIGLVLSAAGAQVIVRGAPPPVIVERPGPALHAGWVWVPGYYRWNGRRYVWVGGYWTKPPRPRAIWVPGRWVPRGGGYVWVNGYWR